MKIRLILFFAFCLNLLPLVAESTPSDGFYIPPAAVSAMKQTEKLPTLRMPPKNYGAEIPVDSTTAPQPSRSIAPKQTPKQKTSAKKFREAPVDDILAHQLFTKNRLARYKKHIVRSFMLKPKDLEKKLQTEISKIDADTRRMQKIQAAWPKQSPAYKFVNYRLNEQINSDIASSRKKYQKRKQAFNELLKETPRDQYISVIESTDNLFWMNTTAEVAPSYSMFTKSMHDTYYVSIFDQDYHHIFSYHRLHIDANRNRRILAAPTGDAAVDGRFQQLFDDYSKDLRRVGDGLDITNINLMRQLGEMKNQVITEDY